METKFQTSFIPKKPLIAQNALMQKAPVRRSISLFLTFGVICFILSLCAVGGTYAWKQFLGTSQDSYRQQLADREKQFNVNLIAQLKGINVQVDLAKQLLNNHLAMSQVFDIISHFTSESSRFLSLDLSAPTTQTDGVKISMRGYGKNFSSVAFQSDVLGKLENYGLRNIVKNPILSDPSLDSNNTVSFGFSASIEPSSMSYKQLILENEASTTPPTSTSPVNTL
ncbi:MAG: hypothetical protein WCP09_03575 [Candidatus Taylorbacteria bacterium]